MDGDVFLTQKGYEKLQEELEYLSKVKRRDISKQIGEARLKGDLKENAEYDAAKEAQAHLEKRIVDLQGKLARVRIIERENIPSDKAYIGATVTVLDLDTEQKEVYMLVSKEEADYTQNKISIESPVGKALLGKAKNEEVTIQVPAGELRYKIVAISRE